MKLKYTPACSIGLILLLGVAAAHVWGAQREGTEQDMYPRTLEILDVGYELPIEIVAVRNLQRREHWIRDLEIEIKNVSPKPIYGVYLTLFIPDDKGKSGAPCAVDLAYGRFELLHPSEHSSAEDKPIESGQSVIIKVTEPVWRGYEGHLRNDSVLEKTTRRLRIAIVAISFGDGTGFINGGVPYPDRPPTRVRPYQYVRVPIDSK